MHVSVHARRSKVAPSSASASAASAAVAEYPSVSGGLRFTLPPPLHAARCLSEPAMVAATSPAVGLPVVDGTGVEGSSRGCTVLVWVAGRRGFGRGRAGASWSSHMRRGLSTGLGGPSIRLLLLRGASAFRTYRSACASAFAPPRDQACTPTQHGCSMV
jgi:hypothetical protein